MIGTKKLWSAVKKIVAYELSCPYCREVIAEPNSGSLYWDVNEIHSGREMECFACKKKFALPRTQ